MRPKITSIIVDIYVAIILILFIVFSLSGCKYFRPKIELETGIRRIEMGIDEINKKLDRIEKKGGEI